MIIREIKQKRASLDANSATDKMLTESVAAKMASLYLAIGYLEVPFFKIET